ncbi:hypothetical protein PMSD_17210 [Paenibacillus macquariensis subsp. defensor]|nr:hypothetical protein PMSD_17210 [Paenibacillus macquariensis subsp. defensor]
MEKEMVFDQEFTIINKKGNEVRFNYFMFEDTPVISYSNYECSFYTKFEYQGWSSKDKPDFANKGLICIVSVNDPLLDWCSLYHELGHVVNNHLLGSTGRSDKVSEGVVSPYELEADQHVLKYVGREKTLIWLESLIEYFAREIKLREQAKEDGYLQEKGLLGLEKLYLGREEVELRIKYL